MQKAEVPSVSGGVLWPDITNKLFYLFGGEHNEVKLAEQFTTLWFYDVIYNTWNHTSSSPALYNIAWPAFGSGTVTDSGTVYYYGGYLSNKTTPKFNRDPKMLSSLITYNMNTGTWLNKSDDTIARAEGILQYLPVSASGMLLYFGGLERDNETQRYVSKKLA